MTDTQVALLRGINVGGKNKLPMKELAAMFADAGCIDVRTYIQSGNVLFRGGPALGQEVPSLISESILSRFGYRVSVLTRTAAELQEVVEANPFLQAGAEADKLHVIFMAAAPDDAQVQSLAPDHSPGDQFAVLGREIYLHCPNGFASTKLTNTYFETKLSTTCTTRSAASRCSTSRATSRTSACRGKHGAAAGDVSTPMTVSCTTPNAAPPRECLAGGASNASAGATTSCSPSAASPIRGCYCKARCCCRGS